MIDAVTERVFSYERGNLPELTIRSREDEGDFQAVFIRSAAGKYDVRVWRTVPEAGSIETQLGKLVNERANLDIEHAAGAIRVSRSALVVAAESALAMLLERRPAVRLSVLPEDHVTFHSTSFELRIDSLNFQIRVRMADVEPGTADSESLYRWMSQVRRSVERELEKR